ncbi:MAG: FKBP-type peptidyl-prolyl cis-trans isomerase [Opitutaceae bacterium]|nr:FKBP-type peptidyl-prolyl cis-trans isomerase [Opitutaceae bacterium]
MKIISSLALLSVTLFFLAGCSKPAETAQESDPELESRVDSLEETVDLIIKDPELARIHKAFPEAESTDSGLHYIVTKEGAGDATPNKGDSVTAHYKGTLLNGAKFDSSYDRGDPFEFQVGLGNVIKGWDEAFLAMKKGEKRKLIIPSKLGYGSRGAGGSIPPNATLIFEVELLDF